jgi:hypothetical protein
MAAWLYQFRREAQDSQAAAEASITLADEQGFPNWFALAKSIQGWAVAAQRTANGGAHPDAPGAGRLAGHGVRGVATEYVGPDIRGMCGDRTGR